MTIKKSFIYETFKSIRGLTNKEAISEIQFKLYLEESNEFPDQVKIESYKEVIDILKKEK